MNTIKSYFSALLICLPLCTLAQAQSTSAAQAAADWPNKPIRWIVPFPPGGAMDVIARALGGKLTQSLGQSVVIENKSGAGGNIGSDFVAKSAGDGYTMMIVSIGMATNRFLYPKLSYDPTKDFAPITLLAALPNVLIVHPSLNVKTVAITTAQHPFALENKKFMIEGLKAEATVAKRWSDFKQPGYEP